VKRLGIIAKTDRDEARIVVPELVDWCLARGLTAVVEKETAGLCPDRALAPVLKPELPGLVDLLLVLGGDGTLLSMARLVGDLGVPILGVNLGGLGFLTATTLEALYPTLEVVLRGEYEAEERMVLAATHGRAGETVADYVALNDVVVAKGALGRLIDLEVSVEGQLVTAYRADGLIISTPTGSTAYNLSAAGPILFPTMDAIVLTPISSHALTNRPLVLPGTVSLEVRLLSDSPDVVLSLDGQPGQAFTAKDVIGVRRANARIRLIRDPQKTYFQVLRTKLKWGQR
jgi:NAD+ kinase